MTTTPMTKEPFQPFNLDLDDQLERIAQAKGVPALTTKPAIAAQATTLNHTAEEGAQQTLPPHRKDRRPYPQSRRQAKGWRPA